MQRARKNERYIVLIVVLLGRIQDSVKGGSRGGSYIA